MAKIGIGIIGCGGRLRHIISELLKTTDKVKLIAICDPNEHSINATKEMLNESFIVYTTVDELVNDPAIEWVMIGSWNCYHAEHAIAAFEAGKHVFCEKPLALKVEDCIAMRNAWLQSGKQFTIGFTLRYSPHYVRIKEIIDAGTIGDIVSMESNETITFSHGGFIHANWRRKSEWAGSHLLEKCCHDIDLINWIVKSTAVKVASFGGCDFFTPDNYSHIKRVGKNKQGKEAFMSLNSHVIMGDIGNPFNEDKDILDNQVAIVQFANGVRAAFHTNCCCAIPERRMYICGTEGTLRSDVISGIIEVKKIGFNTQIEDMSTDASGGHGGGDKILADSLADSIIKGCPSKTGLEDGLRAAFTVFAIDEAERIGKVVDLMPLWKQAGIKVF